IGVLLWGTDWPLALRSRSDLVSFYQRGSPPDASKNSGQVTAGGLVGIGGGARDRAADSSLGRADEDDARAAVVRRPVRRRRVRVHGGGGAAGLPRRGAATELALASDRLRRVLDGGHVGRTLRGFSRRRPGAGRSAVQPGHVNPVSHHQ